MDCDPLPARCVRAQGWIVHSVFTLCPLQCLCARLAIICDQCIGCAIAEKPNHECILRYPDFIKNARLLCCCGCCCLVTAENFSRGTCPPAVVHLGSSVFLSRSITSASSVGAGPHIGSTRFTRRHHLTPACFGAILFGSNRRLEYSQQEQQCPNAPCVVSTNITCGPADFASCYYVANTGLAPLEIM